MGRDEVGCWKTQHCAGSSQEKQKLLDEIEELSLRLSEEQENKRRLGDRLSQERHQFQRDKEATQEVSLAVTAASYRLCTLWEGGSLTPSTGSLSPQAPSPAGLGLSSPAVICSSSRTYASSWSTCSCSSWRQSSAGAGATAPGCSTTTAVPGRVSWSRRSAGSNRCACGLQAPLNSYPHPC